MEEISFKDTVKETLNKLVNDQCTEEDAFLKIHESAYSYNKGIIEIFKVLFEIGNKCTSLKHFNNLCLRFHFFQSILNKVIVNSDGIKKSENVLVHFVKTNFIDIPSFQSLIESTVKQTKDVDKILETIMLSKDCDAMKKIDIFHVISSINGNISISQKMVSLFINTLNEIKDENKITEIVIKSQRFLTSQKQGKDFLAVHPNIHKKIIFNILLGLNSPTTSMACNTLINQKELFYKFDKAQRIELFISFYNESVKPELKKIESKSKLVSIISNSKKDQFFEMLNSRPFTLIEEALEIAKSSPKEIPNLTSLFIKSPVLLKMYLVNRLRSIYEKEGSLNENCIKFTFSLSPICDSYYFQDCIDFILKLLPKDKLLALRVIESLTISLRDFVEITKKDSVSFVSSVEPIHFFVNQKLNDQEDYLISKKGFWNILKKEKCVFKIGFFLSEMKLRCHEMFQWNEDEYDQICLTIQKYFEIIDSVLFIEDLKSYFVNASYEFDYFIMTRDNSVFWKMARIIVPLCSDWEQWKSLSITSNLSFRKSELISKQKDIVTEIKSRESDLFNTVFWLLDLEDIFYPEKLYNDISDEITRHYERDIKRNNIISLTKKHKEWVRCMIRQLKLTDFKKEKFYYIPNKFMSQCLIPRIKTSIKDAMYCAKFILQIFENDIEGVSLMYLLNIVAMYLVGSCVTMTTKETYNVGIFLNILLKQLKEWNSQETYNSNVRGKKGFNSTTIVEYSGFQVVYDKWTGLITKELIVMLSSTEESNVNKAIELYSLISSSLPENIVLKGMVKVLSSKKERQNEKKSQDSDGKVLEENKYLSSYMSQNIGKYQIEPKEMKELLNEFKTKTEVMKEKTIKIKVGIINEMNKKRNELMKEVWEKKKEELKGSIEKIKKEREEQEKKAFEVLSQGLVEKAGQVNKADKQSDKQEEIIKEDKSERRKHHQHRDYSRSERRHRSRERRGRSYSRSRTRSRSSSRRRRDGSKKNNRGYKEREYRN
ncbi:hypothetical protein EDI_072450 [Entamoeba dispar SAW760]|uniref:THO complex subunitTHOC2 C-terminal domain-containing protein n=1 Tax=Entamoeba dispar (strain ATCC PRA-260 / SAW760) TaxID=370354 RepID=B0E962_ENTDS|nr:uncharacterized protein EDI_072450 [Entamoeba dispar SAW760]EDR28936.1 hypothetical protein EDI_072450 [Entamoeba dispar SAW760]|eukprot:EDR28936.1 hypothetical protein EDI_072450 [Entamoeba dispar SAW760]